MFKPIRHLLYTSLSSFLSIFFVPSLLCLVFFFILRLLYSNHSSLCLSFLPSLCFSLVFMPSPLLQAPPSCISFFFFIIVIIIFSSWSCFPSISFLLSHASSSIFLFFLLFLSSYSLLVPPHQQQQQQQLHYLSFKSCLFFFLTSWLSSRSFIFSCLYFFNSYCSDLFLLFNFSFKTFSVVLTVMLNLVY